MVEFWTGAAIAGAVKRNLESATSAHLAVAYWGRGGAERLGLTKDRTNVRIICDLRSLACHPDELQHLLELGVELRTKDRLHAKVYLLSEHAIVGSANASTNGLGDEGSEFDFQLEAAVEISESNVLSSIKSWFEDHWNSSEIVDSDIINGIRADWLRRKRSLIEGNANAGQLFRRLATDPDFFRDVPVKLGIFSYNDEYTEQEPIIWTKVANRYGEDERTKYGDGEYPFYINSTALHFDPNDFLINYWVSCNPDGSIKQTEASGGTWRIIGEETVSVGRSTRRVVLGREKRSVERLKSTKSEYMSVRKVIGKYFKKTSPRPFRDILIRFSDIPNQHPDLFSAIVDWSNAAETFER